MPPRGGTSWPAVPSQGVAYVAVKKGRHQRGKPSGPTPSCAHEGFLRCGRDLGGLAGTDRGGRRDLAADLISQFRIRGRLSAAAAAGVRRGGKGGLVGSAAGVFRRGEPAAQAAGVHDADRQAHCRLCGVAASPGRAVASAALRRAARRAGASACRRRNIPVTPTTARPTPPLQGRNVGKGGYVDRNGHPSHTAERCRSCLSVSTPDRRCRAPS